MHGHTDPSNRIIQYLDRLTAYAQSRVADKELAADAVQEAITKAVKASADLRDEEHAVVCGCFRPLIATLPSDYGQVIQQVDLEEQPREAVASSLGISVANLNVKLHRAREKLRQAIENTCYLCAKHGCLNCSCGG